MNGSNERMNDLIDNINNKKFIQKNKKLSQYIFAYARWSNYGKLLRALST